MRLRVFYPPGCCFCFLSPCIVQAYTLRQHHMSVFPVVVCACICLVLCSLDSSLGSHPLHSRYRPRRKSSRHVRCDWKRRCTYSIVLATGGLTVIGVHVYASLEAVNVAITILDASSSARLECSTSHRSCSGVLIVESIFWVDKQAISVGCNPSNT